jgi:hypothetical protein
MTTLAPGMGVWLASALAVVGAATATATSRVAEAHPHVVVRSSPDPATFPGLGPGVPATGRSRCGYALSSASPSNSGSRRRALSRAETTGCT